MVTKSDVNRCCVMLCGVVPIALYVNDSLGKYLLHDTT